MKIKKPVVILLHAFIGWALCASVMGIGMAVWPVHTALIVHAAAAPVLFFCVSFVYFRFFHYTKPLPTAVLFVLFVILMDFFVVAVIILKSFDMFKSIIGTWIPFALIFLSCYFTGLFFKKKAKG
jgi:hypothetical protein